MKKFIKVVAIIATVMLTSVFIACSNPSSSNRNSTSADPFAGTTWKQQNGDNTIVFSSTENKVVVTDMGEDYAADYTVVDSYKAMIKIGLNSIQFEIDRNNTKSALFYWKKRTYIKQ